MSFFNAFLGPILGLGGAAMQDRAGRRAADAAQRGYERGIGLIGDAGNQARSDLQPWATAGQNALGSMQNYLRGDTSGFENSADYRFAVDQGFRGLQSGATANGNLWGGGADADRIALGQGLAQQYGNQYYGRLQDLSGMGQQAASGQAQVGMNTANALAGLSGNIGNTQASAYANSANSWSNALNQLGGAWGQWQGNNPSSKSPYKG